MRWRKCFRDFMSGIINTYKCPELTAAPRETVNDERVLGDIA